MTTVLLVEDDETVGMALERGIRRARHHVSWARTGAGALSVAKPGARYEVIILDLGLPDVDGVDLCQVLRTRHPDSLIIVVTARDAEIDVIVGLEAGADDYLVKPVSTTELLARMRAHLRRSRASGAKFAGEVASVGSLKIDRSRRRAWVADIELPLRAKQFDLLSELVTAAGVAVARSDLMLRVWDENWFGSTKTLDVHIAGLRRVLIDAARRGSLAAPVISTLRGYGYRLDAPEAPPQVLLRRANGGQAPPPDAPKQRS